MLYVAVAVTCKENSAIKYLGMDEAAYMELPEALRNQTQFMRRAI
jgi:hypothetical protein